MLQPVCQDQDHQDRQFCLGEASSVGVGLNEFLLKQFFRPPLPPSFIIAPNFSNNRCLETPRHPSIPFPTRLFSSSSNRADRRASR